MEENNDLQGPVGPQGAKGPKGFAGSSGTSDSGDDSGKRSRDRHLVMITMEKAIPLKADNFQKLQ